MREWLIGVDEAGRGPLAGPVAVGIVAVPLGFDIGAEFRGVTDSKLLNPQKRGIVFAEVERRVALGDLRVDVRMSSHRYIDKHGITSAVRKGVWGGVREIAPQSEGTVVMLDGLLHAPREYVQRTVTGGDLKVPVISLASIVAKVTRDRLMERLAMRYPEYGFDAHKGYGTPEHRLAIARFGLCDIHRRTYCGSVKSSIDLQSRTEA
jgi:ribonuclease HII